MDNPFFTLDDSGDPYAPGAATLYTDADLSDAAKMVPFTPRVQGAEAAPWWQGLVSYGITKAIDNTLPGRTPGIAGNTSPGSFAGQNGASYRQSGPLNQPPQLAAMGLGGSVAGFPSWLLLAGAVALFIAFKK
jgi:hypothetical protein